MERLEQQWSGMARVIYSTEHLFPLEHDRPTVEDVSPKSQDPNSSHPKSQSSPSPNPKPTTHYPLNSIGETGLRWKPLPQREAKIKASNRIKQHSRRDQDQDV